MGSVGARPGCLLEAGLAFSSVLLLQESIFAQDAWPALQFTAELQLHIVGQRLEQLFFFFFSHQSQKRQACLPDRHPEFKGASVL